MIDSLTAQISSWNNARGITLKFVSELSDKDLDKKFPRKNLNTIRLQVEEMAWVQKNFIDALNTKVMEFIEIPLEDTSKHGIVKRLTELDTELVKTLENFDGTETIDFYGEPGNVHEHISSMIAHENMHIGQIVAFCYATGIDIPADIVESMALDG